MCGPKFCSMRISQDVRDYAAANGLTEERALTEGMMEESSEFLRAGAEIYPRTTERT
jgi:phosphomethylpyrimidine synthase